ncbi:MAG: DHA2 family efflux MFS transporter permease subunit [Pseudonocardiaceae bacterium]
MSLPRAARPTGGAVGTPGAGAGWGLPLVVLIVGMFMSVLDTSIVNVAIPTLQNEFGATTDQVQWVVTGYTLVLGVVVPASAWLGDRLGLKRLYNLSLLGFAAGSALCGLGWDLNSLIVFRIIQAIPGGILPVVSLSMLYRIVPRHRIGTAMGLYGLGIVVAPAIGPTLGGYLVEYVNWRLIFYINVPVGILGTVAASLVLPRFPRISGRRFDFLGFLTVASGLLAVLLALSEGESWGWYSYRVLGLITFSVLSLALFVVIELEVADPLLDVRVFRYWAFTNSLLLISVLMVGLFGVLFYIPLFLQQVQGMGAFDAGLTLLPQALVMAVLMPLAGRIYDRVGPRWPATIGVAIVALATYLMHNLTIDTSREQIIWWLMLRAVGLGLAMMPIMTGGIAAIPAARVNAASAFNNIAQRTSAALGLAVLTAIFTTQQAEQLAGRAALLPADTVTPHLGGPTVPDWVGAYATYQQTQLQVFVGGLDDLFLIAAGLSAVGALGALFLRSGPAPAPPVTVPPPQQASTPTAPANGGPVRDGAIAAGVVAAGAVAAGAVVNGAVVAGAAGNGTVTNGALADGTAANGAVTDGRSRGRPHAAANSADNGNPTQPNDDPTQPNDDLLDVERDGSPRDT